MTSVLVIEVETQLNLESVLLYALKWQ